MKKFFAVAVLSILALASASAFANDQLTSSVTPLTGPTPVIVNNGVPSGTIQLWYHVVGSQFTCGQFAQFTLNLNDAAGTSGQAPSYPVTLNLAQSGNGTPVQLAPATTSFSVADNTWSDSTTVTVNIDCSKLAVPTDGQDIVGNLNVSTSPSGSHLNTISTIQVHIVLAFPAESACLKLYSFQTDPDTGGLLSTISLVENSHKGTVTSTNPGIVSVDGLVVNTCPDSKTFGLGIGLDSNWSTNPSNNPGNAVFTFTETGELDPTVTNFTVPTTGGTGQGQALCLDNVSLASGNSYLVTVHSQLNSGIAISSLPATAFTFSAALSTAGTSCSSASYLPTTLVGPANPVTSSLPYT
ncbi:MAG TPA: hypothetical protein VFL96_04350, partial [Acidobacteriaceae bacterium]|nr:hypothetical protein [Acidobacteriaceae bacterium]